MVSFGNFARIASLGVGFHLGTLHGYFFSTRLLAKFEFPARTSNKTCLKLHAKIKKISQLRILSLLTFIVYLCFLEDKNALMLKISVFKDSKPYHN